MKTNEEVVSLIEKEFTTAKHAVSIGNEGMVRVCARRACGIAITYLLEYFPEKKWGNDAMNQLKSLQTDVSFSEESRDAAMRLTTKVNQQFSVPFSENPIDDAKIIIEEVENKLRVAKL
ncbi:MAG: hypothetical protein KGZ58_02075 [Ignavibacteriales bacterium]|nr:hypothetical protein [Ignavibacteriales bacterium]